MKILQKGRVICLYFNRITGAAIAKKYVGLLFVDRTLFLTAYVDS